MFVRPAPRVYKVHIPHVYFLNYSHLKLKICLIYIWVASKIITQKKEQKILARKITIRTGLGSEVCKVWTMCHLTVQEVQKNKCSVLYGL